MPGEVWAWVCARLRIVDTLCRGTSERGFSGAFLGCGHLGVWIYRVCAHCGDMSVCSSEVNVRHLFILGMIQVSYHVTGECCCAGGWKETLLHALGPCGSFLGEKPFLAHFLHPSRFTVG